MPERTPLVPFLTALGDLASWLQEKNFSGVLIGGVAASLLGRPRATRDIDALILLDERHWKDFLASGARFGFAARRADCLAFARESRVLLVRHESSEIDVDVVFGSLPFEKEAVERALWSDVGGISVPLPTPEDLIIMKAVAQRPRDLADIEAIADAHPDLDRERVFSWVDVFSAALETPDIADDLRLILTRPPKRGT